MELQIRSFITNLINFRKNAAKHPSPSIHSPFSVGFFNKNLFPVGKRDFRKILIYQIPEPAVIFQPETFKLQQERITIHAPISPVFPGPAVFNRVIIKNAFSIVFYNQANGIRRLHRNKRFLRLHFIHHTARSQQKGHNNQQCHPFQIIPDTKALQRHHP